MKLGIQSYLPTVKKIKQWSDRKKQVIEALLPGYIFIFATEKERLLALTAASVVRCITENSRPAVIPSEQIENLRQFVKDEFEYRVVNSIVPGMKVRIKEGSFKEVIGVIIEEPTSKSLAVSIELLNRTVITYLSDLSIVEPVSY